jgi:diketogulonate reductase-like aldo/keto reductase
MDFTLHSGRKMPGIAFGTGTSYFERNQDVTEGILKAFHRGFRHIDTAIMYDTENGVGEAVKRLILNGNKRQDIYVTTKVNSDQYTYEKV